MSKLNLPNIKQMMNDSRENQKNISDNNNYKFEANHNYFIICTYAFFLVLACTLSSYLIWHFDIVTKNISNFLSTVSAFIIAFFIAYFMNPIVKIIYNYLFIKLLKSKHEKRDKIFSILIAYIIIITLFVLLMIFVVPQVFLSISDLTVKVSDEIPTLYKKINEELDIVEKKFPLFDWKAVEKELKNAMPQFLELTTNFVTFLFEKVINISISVVSAFLSLLISIMVSIYMIMDKHLLARNAKRFVYAIFSKEHSISICRTVKDCNTIFYNFVIGKALDSLIIGFITLFSMSILKLDYTILISLIVGITNMIPYFGPFIGAIPGIAILLIVDPVQSLIFTILIIIIQQFDGLYLGPKILGDSVGIKPLWVIFGITLGGAYAGPFGMFMGVPFVAIIAYLINKFITYKLLNKNITSKNLNN